MNDARDVDQERMRGMMRWMSIGEWRRGCNTCHKMGVVDLGMMQENNPGTV